MKNPLLDYIQRVRTDKANNNCLQSASLFISIFLLLFAILGGLEFVFHFGSFNRQIMFEILLSTFIGSLFYIILRWVIQSNALFGNYSNDQVATWIGEQKPEISDRLLNGIQLGKSKTPQNEDLINHAIQRLIFQIEKVP